MWNEAENRERDWGETFFSLASHALRACEARAVRAHKTLTPRVTDFFTDFEEKTDCFAVYCCKYTDTLFPNYVLYNYLVTMIIYRVVVL